MVLTTRRSVLGLAVLAAAGGTVAAVEMLRKPAPVIYTPVVEPEVKLEGIAALKPVDPPAALPGFSFADAGGAAHTLAEFAGKGVVLNLWATWCMPCVAELPSLAKLAAELASAGVMVLPLSGDRGGAAVVQKFYAEHRIDGLGVWVDPKGTAAEALGVQGLPTTFLVGRDGRVRGRLEGGADWASADAVAAVRRLVG